MKNKRNRQPKRNIRILSTDFEIRLRDKKAVQAVEELLLTYNPHGLVFYLITDFVQFPDYPLWEIFISHDSLPFEMNPYLSIWNALCNGWKDRSCRQS